MVAGPRDQCLPAPQKIDSSGAEALRGAVSHGGRLHGPVGAISSPSSLSQPSHRPAGSLPLPLEVAAVHVAVESPTRKRAGPPASSVFGLRLGTALEGSAVKSALREALCFD